MARICIFTQTLLAGGAEKDAVLLANSLIEKHPVFILIYYGERTEEKLLKLLVSKEIKLVRLNGNHFSKALQICRFFKNENIEIVFSMLLLPNFLGGILGRLSGVKYPLGGIKSAQLDASKVWLNKFLQNNVNRLTIYNNYKGLEVNSNKGFKKQNAVVIPNSLEYIPDALKRNLNETVVILSVGRFHPAKDYQTALQAIKLLNKKNIQFIYQLVGYGELESEIRSWINELKLNDCVQLIINPPNLKEIYQKADIFLMTSLFEGLSNAVLEAMSYSLPIVVTRVGDMDRVVKNGENGFLCEPRDFVTIAEKVEYLCDHYEKRLEFGAVSHRIVSNEYSFEVSKKRYLDLIESLSEN